MKLYRLPEAKGIDALSLIEADTPKPGRGQVLVKMHAASLNYRDLGVVAGTGRGPLKPNLVPLSDGAGEVVEIGADVTRVKPGDRVAGIFNQQRIGARASPLDRGAVLGGGIDGVLAEYVVFDQSGLVTIPSHLSYAEASCLPCAAVTAWNALYGLHALAPGESVLALGTGGVSIFALQFARLAGARAIVTSSSDAKLARATSLGAAAGINYKTTPEWQKTVLELTGGAGVDHVIETGGAGTVQRSIEAAKNGGTVNMIGVLTGAGAQLNPMLILQRGCIVRGIQVGSREMFEAMNRAIEHNLMRPVIDREFSFAEAKAALHYLKSQAHFGKIVITIGR